MPDGSRDATFPPSAVERIEAMFATEAFEARIGTCSSGTA
jgi:hypothetical protein